MNLNIVRVASLSQKRYWGRCVRKINYHCNSSVNKHTTHSRGGGVADRIGGRDGVDRKERSHQSCATDRSKKIGCYPQDDPSAGRANQSQAPP